jgi:hypothetical protein
VKTLAPESTWQKTNLDTCPWLQTGIFFKVKELRKNQLFFHENWWFFEGFEIPRTSGLFNSDVFKYPEPASSLILIFFQIPKTGSSLKNQRTAQH